MCYKHSAIYQSLTFSCHTHNGDPSSPFFVCAYCNTLKIYFHYKTPLRVAECLLVTAHTKEGRKVLWINIFVTWFNIIRITFSVLFTQHTGEGRKCKELLKKGNLTSLRNINSIKVIVKESIFVEVYKKCAWVVACVYLHRINHLTLEIISSNSYHFWELNSQFFFFFLSTLENISKVWGTWMWHLMMSMDMLGIQAYLWMYMKDWSYFLAI